LNPTDDRSLRDASQVALTLVREEVAKGSDADGALVQNLIASSIQLAQRAAQVQPQESLNWNNLGTVYQSLTGLVDDVERLAEDAFRKAGELRPGDPAFDNRAGAMWLARADLIRSVATRQNASQLQEQYAQSLTNAELAFNRALEKSPSFGLSIYNRAAVYDRQNKVAEAILDLEKIAPANANEPTLMFELGLLYARANRLDEAMAAMRRAVLLAPQYANARWYLALLLEEKGDSEGALVQLREIEKNNADNEILKAKIKQLTAVPPVPATEDAIDNPPLQ
jgi:tetratricopeptide (TPR) repeat protein